MAYIASKLTQFALLRRFCPQGFGMNHEKSWRFGRGQCLSKVCVFYNRGVHTDNEALQMRDVVDSTPFELLGTLFRCRSDRHTDYHPGGTEVGADFLYYDTFAHSKILMAVADGCVSATVVVPEGSLDRWEHPEEERQWVPLDSTYDNTCVVTPDVWPTTTVMIVEQINSAHIARLTADVHVATNVAGTKTRGHCDAQTCKTS